METFTPWPHRMVRTPAEIKEALDELRRPVPPADGVIPVVGFDLETSGLSHTNDTLCLAQLANKDHCFLLPFKELEPDAIRLLKDYIEQADKRPPLVAHNAPFEWKFCKANGIDIPHGFGFFDTMLMEQLLTAGLKADASLEATVGRRLRKALPKGFQTSYWFGPSAEYLPQQETYAAADACAEVSLFACLYIELFRAGLLRVFEREMRCIVPYARMSYDGIYVDRKDLTALRDRKRRAAERFHGRVLRVLNHERIKRGLPGYPATLFGGIEPSFRLSQTAKVAEELVALGVPLVKTEKDKWSIDKDELKLLREQFPFLGPYLRWKATDTEATDAQKYLGHIAADGRMHPNFRQASTATGRSACASPNVQNVSRSKAFRRTIRPAPGNRILKVDYSQVELRTCAQITQDKIMLEAYRNGEDLHWKTAEIINNKPRSQLTSLDRTKAKSIIFGLIYGLQATSLQRYCLLQYNVRLTEQEAIDFFGRFMSEYQGVRDWHESIKDEIAAGGYKTVRTISGRRRIMTNDDRRLAVVANTLIQAPSACITKEAMAALPDALAEFDLIGRAWPINVVHDEINLEVEADYADLAFEVLTAVMEDAQARITPGIPPLAEGKIAYSWAGDMEPLS